MRCERGHTDGYLAIGKPTGRRSAKRRPRIARDRFRGGGGGRDGHLNSLVVGAPR